jgi:hypothetical protein
MSHNLIGQLSARPQEASTASCAELIALINERICPPQPLQAGDVHVRSLRLVSDDVNDHGGRFPREEHARVCELLIDSPVLIGHDRSRLPVARNFAARCLAEGDRQWVQVWFYWMRGLQGDRLAADIDGGVVKEGSIGFEFRRPQCSICGRDIRTCEHIPGHEYAGETGATSVAHYEYRDIVRILETSLVYRGANPNTRLGNDPVFCKLSPQPPTEMILGIVLDRRPLPGGLKRYVIARRDSVDPTVCDELIALSRSDFRIGELVFNRHGLWRRMSPARAHDGHAEMRIQSMAFLCGRSVPLAVGTGLKTRGTG